MTKPQTFVSAEEIEELLKDPKFREGKVFHLCCMDKNSELTEDEAKLLFIKGIIQGDYDN